MTPKNLDELIGRTVVVHYHDRVTPPHTLTRRELKLIRRRAYGTVIAVPSSSLEERQNLPPKATFIVYGFEESACPPPPSDDSKAEIPEDSGGTVIEVIEGETKSEPIITGPATVTIGPEGEVPLSPVASPAVPTHEIPPRTKRNVIPRKKKTAKAEGRS